MHRRMSELRVRNAKKRGRHLGAQQMKRAKKPKQQAYTLTRKQVKEMCSEDSKLQTAAYTWCEMHGISIDYADTIRQRFYRERERLLSCGVDLRKRNRIKTDKKR